MDAEQGTAFLTALKAKKIRVKDNGWIEAACPLAPWTHKNGHDHTPSFGLSISPGLRSYYSCFACQHGSAEELLQTLELYTKDHHGDYDFATCHLLLDGELKVLPLPPYGEAEPLNTFQEWPAYWLSSFQHVSFYGDVVNYLKGRGLSDDDMVLYQLVYDIKRSMVVAPYYDVWGRLAGARGRSILPHVDGAKKHYDYSFNGTNNCRLVWYNEYVLNLPGPVVIVEGQFDCWNTVRAYPKTMANLTAKPSYEKMKKLADCPFVIQIPDRDDAGQMSMEYYVKLCAQLGIGYKAVWLDEDPDNPTAKMDPGMCSVSYLKEKIEKLL